MSHAPITCIGNAIVDVLAPVDEAFLTANGLARGAMTLIDTETAETLYAKMPPGKEASGGSGANTAAGIAGLGGGVRYFGRVADDQLGEVFRHDLVAAGVHYDVPFSNGGTPTARCLILVTPDGERTMNTYLGTSVDLGEAEVDYDAVSAAKLLYLEGYLWDSDTARPAMERAVQAVRGAGGRAAFTLSDGFCVDRHRDSFRELAAGGVDILFANADELTSLYETQDLAAALDAQRGKVDLAIVTRSAEGAVILAGDETIEIAAEPVDHVVDTTGAGDLFAAGVLAGLEAGRPLAECGRMGAVAAAEIISHYGARPEADLKALIS
ncbi:MAG: adenosine kinase [Pseudomonadota bacterium]